MKKHQSPCIDICEFSGTKGWCLGCGRTRQECQKWKSMTPYARKALQKQLQKRISKIKRATNADS